MLSNQFYKFLDIPDTAVNSAASKPPVQDSAVETDMFLSSKYLIVFETTLIS